MTPRRYRCRASRRSSGPADRTVRTAPPSTAGRRTGRRARARGRSTRGYVNVPSSTARPAGQKAWWKSSASRSRVSVEEDEDDRGGQHPERDQRQGPPQRSGDRSVVALNRSRIARLRHGRLASPGGSRGRRRPCGRRPYVSRRPAPAGAGRLIAGDPDTGIALWHSLLTSDRSRPCKGASRPRLRRPTPTRPTA